MMDFSSAQFNIVGRFKLWSIISAGIIVIGLIAMGIRTANTGFPLKRGIDFEGGSIIKLEYKNWDQGNPADFAHEVEQIVSGYTAKAPSVQSSETETGLILHIRADASLIESAGDDHNLNTRTQMYNDIRAAGGDFEILEENEVGAVIGQELTVKAIQGVFVGLLLILIYITIRLSFDFAVFAIIALAHDVLILCTVFAIFGFEINSPFVAVLLTVVGYSINDTIIIYDRIRENMKIKRHLTFDMMVNQSLLETMARSINTSGTTLLAILAILILGGISLQAFMVGLGVGIFAGTYSSIFIASPLLVLWRMKKKGTLEIEKEVKPVIDMISDDDDEDEEEESGTDQITGLSGPVSPKPSSGRKKRRRRRQ